MNTYIVAYMTFFENVMCMERVSAGSESEAMLSVLSSKGWDINELDDDKSNSEKIKAFAFDCDAVIGAMQI